MDNPFPTETRLFATVQAYLDLVKPLQIRAYSGATKLYVMSGLGVTLRAIGDLSALQASLAQDEILLTPPLSIVLTGIRSNCVLYAKLLSQVIRYRLDTRGDADHPADGKSARRRSYNLSTGIAQRVDRLVVGKERQNSIFMGEIEWQNLAEMCQIEYARLVNLHGVLPEAPRQTRTILALLDALQHEFVTATKFAGDRPQAYHLPMLSVLLVVARMLYGDLGRHRCPMSPMGPLSQRPWISDSTLAALPWPTQDLVQCFPEKDAGLISETGWRYLHHATHVFCADARIAA